MNKTAVMVILNYIHLMIRAFINTYLILGICSNFPTNTHFAQTTLPFESVARSYIFNNSLDSYILYIRT